MLRKNRHENGRDGNQADIHVLSNHAYSIFNTTMSANDIRPILTAMPTKFSRKRVQHLWGCVIPQDQLI